MKPSPFRLAWSLLLVLCAFLRLSAADTAPLFRDVPVSASGLVGEGIALFTPEGLSPSTLPPSLALISPRAITGDLPASWPTRPGFQTNGKQFRASVTIDEGTDLYGSGEVTGPLRRNGQSITLWNTDNFTYREDKGRRLYQSHPWILGLRKDGSAFGVLFDSTWKAELSCEKQILFTSEGPAFPVYVINRASPAEVLQALAELTGTMPLPPKWALGYQQSRWSYNPDSRVKEIADTFRAKQIPCDVIWMDIDYMDGFRVFSFDKKQFPDPKGLNSYLHSKGFKSVWMIDPGVKIDPANKVYDSGTKADLWVKTAAGKAFEGTVWPGPCVFPDFTMPEVRTWWADLYADYMATGIDGVWNDMNEPSVFDSANKTMPEDNHHRGGAGLAAGPHLQYHNVYGLLMARASREGILAVNPDKRPFLLTRSNFIGGQRYAATWTGDNSSTPKHMRLSVPMSITLGLSGQPFNGPDLGGFSENANSELWSDWVTMGVFFPFCRGHAVKGSNNKEPWAFGAEVEATARIAINRRYRLMPYLYTLFEEASRSGLPVMRPLFMADPKDPALRSEEKRFMVGDSLIVTPRYAISRRPHMPAGTWHKVSLAPGDLADRNQALVQVRAGSIIPLGPLAQNTSEQALDPLTLLVCLDENNEATGSLYEDAGDGFAYQKGAFLRTQYKAVLKDGKVDISITKSEGKLTRPPRKVLIELLDRKGQRLEGTTWYL